MSTLTNNVNNDFVYNYSNNSSRNRINYNNKRNYNKHYTDKNKTMIIITRIILLMTTIAEAADLPKV